MMKAKGGKEDHRKLVDRTQRKEGMKGRQQE